MDDVDSSTAHTAAHTSSRGWSQVKDQAGLSQIVKFMMGEDVKEDRDPEQEISLKNKARKLCKMFMEHHSTIQVVYDGRLMSSAELLLHFENSSSDPWVDFAKHALEWTQQYSAILTVTASNEFTSQVKEFDGLDKELDDWLTNRPVKAPDDKSKEDLLRQVVIDKLAALDFEDETRRQQEIYLRTRKARRGKRGALTRESNRHSEGEEEEDEEEAALANLKGSKASKSFTNGACPSSQGNQKLRTRRAAIYNATKQSNAAPDNLPFERTSSYSSTPQKPSGPVSIAERPAWGYGGSPSRRHSTLLSDSEVFVPTYKADGYGSSPVRSCASKKNTLRFADTSSVCSPQLFSSKSLSGSPETRGHPASALKGKKKSGCSLSSSGGSGSLLEGGEAEQVGKAAKDSVEKEANLESERRWKGSNAKESGLRPLDILGDCPLAALLDEDDMHEEKNDAQWKYAGVHNAAWKPLDGSVHTSDTGHCSEEKISKGQGDSTWNQSGSNKSSWQPMEGSVHRPSSGRDPKKEESLYKWNRPGTSDAGWKMMEGSLRESFDSKDGLSKNQTGDHKWNRSTASQSSVHSNLPALPHPAHAHETVRGTTHEHILQQKKAVQLVRHPEADDVRHHALNDAPHGSEPKASRRRTIHLGSVNEGQVSKGRRYQEDDEDEILSKLGKQRRGSFDGTQLNPTETKTETTGLRNRIVKRRGSWDSNSFEAMDISEEVSRTPSREEKMVELRVISLIDKLLPGILSKLAAVESERIRRGSGGSSVSYQVNNAASRHIVAMIHASLFGDTSDPRKAMTREGTAELPELFCEALQETWQLHQQIQVACGSASASSCVSCEVMLDPHLGPQLANKDLHTLQQVLLAVHNEIKTHMLQYMSQLVKQVERCAPSKTPLKPRRPSTPIPFQARPSPSSQMRSSALPCAPGENGSPPPVVTTILMGLGDKPIKNTRGIPTRATARIASPLRQSWHPSNQ